ncbi:hypothetical protein HY086_05290 [Candidatus Gottesmanbacteria bacterium]|nr:hypothetical protein [Candidatus Gottesmanbacteria bacterium]
MKKNTLFLISAVFLLSRLFFLDRLPIFNDEALFMHLGADAVAGLRPWWSALLFEGKPGHAVSLGLAQLLPIDPLVAARSLSVVFGLITTFFLLASYKIIFKRKTTVTVAVVFLATPYLVFFQRMALAESAVMAASAGIIYGSLLKRSLLMGVIFGLGWWWKASILSLAPAAAAVFFSPVAVVVAILVASPLLLLPAFQALPLGEVKSVYRLNELLAFPIGRWWENTIAVIQWLLGYLSPGVVILLIIGLIHSIKQKRAPLLLFFFLPLVISILMGKILAARHIAPAIPAALLLAAEGITMVEKQFRRWGRLLIAMLVGSAVIVSGLLIFSPLDFYRSLAFVPRAQADFSQYVIGWPSGYGVKEVVEWFQTNRRDKPTLVVVRTDSGNPEDAVFVYLQRMPHMTVAYIDWLPDLLQKEKGRWRPEDIFFVSRGAQYDGLAQHVKERARFKKPLDPEFVGIYQIVYP